VDGSDDPRWSIAWRVCEAIRRKYPAEVRAIGVHGALAHADGEQGADFEADSDVNIVVVSYRPRTGPAPTSRRIEGLVVDLGVISAEEYLSHARTLSTSWPLAADQYLTTRALYDDTGWHEALRDTHLTRLAEASGREFSALARQAWCSASALVKRAAKANDWYDTDGALLLLVQARIATAMVEGLLGRTYFRGRADAVRRTGLAGEDIPAVRERLAAQAEELQRRGRPVDGDIWDLV
jgi:predicted NAD-dependent protein-ADP-ribosyltransferase YbiA (DUF1768 family)